MIGGLKLVNYLSISFKLFLKDIFSNYVKLPHLHVIYNFHGLKILWDRDSCNVYKFLLNTSDIVKQLDLVLKKPSRGLNSQRLSISEYLFP